MIDEPCSIALVSKLICVHVTIMTGSLFPGHSLHMPGLQNRNEGGSTIRLALRGKKVR
ncbi:hypothetical protein AN958_05976 [Leucoagaricus sp. SymC.cos]|nr:hypothetical protein AN958_05976 [Leucoagaricus sp. SymC.cos]